MARKRRGFWSGQCRMVMDVPRDLLYAALGAIVTVVAFQVPLAPLVGGAVAAGVRRNPTDEGVRDGAIAGIRATSLL